MSSRPSESCGGPWTSLARRIAPAQVPKNAPPFVGEFFQRVEEAFFLHYFQVRGAFAAGEDYAFDAGEIFGAADEGVLGAEAIEDFRVGVVVALDGEDSDFCVLVIRDRSHFRTLKTHTLRSFSILIGSFRMTARC